MWPRNHPTTEQPRAANDGQTTRSGGSNPAGRSHSETGPADPRPPRWRDMLSLDRSAAAMLVVLLFITCGIEVWTPLMPKEVESRGGTILVIAAYGCLRDALRAASYFVGGGVAGQLNARRGLLGFGVLPLAGLAVLLLWSSPYAALVAVPLAFAWESISGPATLRVLGERLDPSHRTMAFFLLGICRRSSRLLAYSLSAVMLWLAGRQFANSARAFAWGFYADVYIAAGAIILALIVQWRYLQCTAIDREKVVRRPWQALRGFHPDLKRLLVSDILARVADGMPREFLILFAITVMGFPVHRGAAVYTALLLNLELIVGIATYILIGPRASRAGLAKKPFIGSTFVFFAAFPLALAILAPSLGLVGLCLGYVVAGLRQVGEPARKAMVTEFLPPETETQTLGIYWGMRGIAVCLAPLVGGLLWLAGNALQPGSGPYVMLIGASTAGWLGAVLFYATFGRSTKPEPNPCQSPQTQREDCGE